MAHKVKGESKIPELTAELQTIKETAVRIASLCAANTSRVLSQKLHECQPSSQSFGTSAAGDIDPYGLTGRIHAD
jgi:hypothetical protein